jgi:aldehyde dehydrogenase (NAD+)
MKYSRPAAFIDGQWATSPNPKVIQVISPSTEALVGVADAATPGDVDAAVAAARRALVCAEWADLDPGQRATLLRRLADKLEERAAETAAMVTDENGMPSRVAQVAEGKNPAATLRYYADLAETTPAESTRVSPTGRRTIVRRSPIGVVAAVVPWNFPQSLTMFKLAPALAAGCTVVIKPAPETALDAYQLADAAEEAGLPPGVLNIVSGGRDIGAHLVAHPDVDKVAFTGSTAAGRQIAEACGRLLRPVTLELGGKSAAIILDDADLAKVARGLAWASLLNNGQTCYSCTRIIAPRSRYTETVDAVAQLARSLTVGDPTDAATHLGPLVSRRHRDRVEGYIESGLGSGARLVAGGGRPAHLPRGWYVEPTVFVDVDNTTAIAREEIFGPVLAVLPYETVDDAVRMANDSPFGLGGTVWTTDPDRGLEVARRIETGSVGINFFDLDINAPFGGVKDSGLGRELGPEGLDAYVTVKSIYLR